MSVYADRNPNLFENMPHGAHQQARSGKKAKDNHPCTEESRAMIVSEMEKCQYYLNEELTLHAFAEEINMSSRLISSCINKSLGCNFNEWVNNYRVENALRLIKSDENNLLSIEGIGSDSGFKSRSAMYAAFKKKLGHSPGYYRKA